MHIPSSLRNVSLGLAALSVIALSAVFEVNADNKVNNTLGQGSCGSGQDQCHKSTFTGWYDNDPHNKSIDKLNDEERKSTQYAKPFGLNYETLFDGTSMCMDCHGTVISGSENEYTDYGVGCESCHGPAELYLKGHELGNLADEHTRAGYLDALSKGLMKLADNNILAKTCVGCHLITDEKLIRAGHVDGTRFGYKSGLTTVANKRHWKRYKLSDKKKDVFETAAMNLVDKNKVSVTFAPTPAPAGNPQGSTVIRIVDTLILGREANTKPVTLPPFPLLSDSLSFEEIMLLVAKRIEVVANNIGDRK